MTWAHSIPLALTVIFIPSFMKVAALGSVMGDAEVDALALSAPDFSLNGQWEHSHASLAKIQTEMKKKNPEREKETQTEIATDAGVTGQGKSKSKRLTSRKRKLDSQFATYIHHVVFTSIIEDFDVSEQISRDDFMNEVARVFREMCRAEGLREDLLKPTAKNELVSDFLKNEELEDPAYFSAYLHAQLKVASWQLRAESARERAMQRIGRRLFDIVRAYVNLDNEVADMDEAPSLSDIKSWLKTLVNKLVNWGYFLDAGVKWKAEAATEWKKKGTASFVFWYKGAVTWQPSSHPVRRIPGMEQELASRMVEAFFMSLGMDATNVEPRIALGAIDTGLASGWDLTNEHIVKENWTIESL